jgi:catechol 2,3-dioxygenase-like lactoylglutathione lyase family enzyme
MSLLERIDTICLSVKNVEKASRWYQETLGFKESFKGENYRIFTIGNSDVPLTIEESNAISSNNNNVYPIFYSKNIEHTYELLKEKNVTLSELQNDGVNTFFDLYDLDGNKLQVCFWKSSK